MKKFVDAEKIDIIFIGKSFYTSSKITKCIPKLSDNPM